MSEIEQTLNALQADSEIRSERSQLIRWEVLRILKQCGGYLLAAPALVTHLRANLPGHISEGEIEENLQWLRNERLVCQVKPKIGQTKWMITDDGRALLEQNK
jgi:hypothetical protein